MKAKGIFFSLVVLLAAAGGALYYYNPNMVKQHLGLPYVDANGSYVGRNLKAADWSDPAAIQAKIGPQILAKIGPVNDENVTRFLKSDENRLLLAQWMMAQKFLDRTTVNMEEKGIENRAKELENARKRSEELYNSLPKGAELSHRQQFNKERNDEELAKIEAEAAAPHTLKEVMDTPGAGSLVERIGNTLTWANQFAFGMECTQPAVALSILNTISKKDKDFDKKSVNRDIATATALEFARSNWRQADAVARYKFYSKHYKKGNLNSVFKTLPFWQRRMVCGCKGDNEFGSVESLEWLVENAKLPMDQYPGSCWRCAYRLFNYYGESIHGSLFVTPFDEVYGHNRARLAYEVGGVCGFLSHFGAFAALANGVPATTSGEPAHCSYVVLVGDRWTPSYSLSWQRGMHWTVFNDNHRYAALHMASELFSPEQKAKTDLADAYRVLAGEMNRQNKPEQALQYHSAAVAAQPLHYVAWREYAQYIEDKAPDSPSAWVKYNKQMCKDLVPVYPENADMLLSSYAYNPMAKAMEADPEALSAEMMRFWGAVGEMGPDRWRIEELVARQAKLLKVNEKDAKSITPFAGSLVGSLTNAPKYLPVVLSWATAAANKLPSEADKQGFLQSTVKELGKVQGGAGTDVLAPLILAAENARDMNSFQAIARMLPPDRGRPGIPKFQPFDGKLVSEGGLVWTSSTCRHDAPCDHPGMLELQGGRFHSDKETNPYVVVQLPKQATLNGIVIVGTTGNTNRLYDMHVQVSQTAKDGDWHDVAVLPNGNNRVMRVDLKDKRPITKYIRVLRGGKNSEFFHLNGIYAYGVPAA